MSDLDAYRPNVGVVLFNRDGLVWYGQRHATPGPHNWQFPQGGVDAGEDLEAAARRELHEETGVTSIELLARTIRRRFAFDALMVTRSEKGLSLLAEDSVTHIPTYAREVFDVSGAGDTVAAVMGAALAAGLKPSTAAHLANLAAGVVVAKLGTYAISAAELETALAEIQHPEEWEQ